MANKEKYNNEMIGCCHVLLPLINIYRYEKDTVYFKVTPETMY